MGAQYRNMFLLGSYLARPLFEFTVKSGVVNNGITHDLDYCISIEKHA